MPILGREAMLGVEQAMGDVIVDVPDIAMPARSPKSADCIVLDDVNLADVQAKADVQAPPAATTFVPPTAAVVPWDRHLDEPNIHAVDVWLTPEMLAQRRVAFGLEREGVTSFLKSVEFVSLGSFCAVSRALQSLGLKRYSYPFDWTRSPVEGVIHCLDTQFEDFLTFTSFRIEGQLKVFESTRWGGSFWHHDLEAPGTKEDFTRRIQRLLGSGEVPPATTRVYVRSVNSAREVEKAAQLRDALKRANPEATIYLLLIVDLQLEKAAIRIAGSLGEGLLFFCIHESLYTQVLASRPNMDGLERLQFCSDCYSEAISFAVKFWAGEADAVAETKVVQSIKDLSTELQQWDGGSAAYQLFCPRKFRGQQVNATGATQLPRLIDPSAFCDFVLPATVMAGQMLLVYAFGMGLNFQMPDGVCFGQWLRVTLIEGQANGQVIWPQGIPTTESTTTATVGVDLIPPASIATAN